MANEKKAPAAAASYSVLTPVKRGKVTYRKGAKLDLTAAEAAPLLRHKSVELAK